MPPKNSKPTAKKPQVKSHTRQRKNAPTDTEAKCNTLKAALDAEKVVSGLEVDATMVDERTQHLVRARLQLESVISFVRHRMWPMAVLRLLDFTVSVAEADRLFERALLWNDIEVGAKQRFSSLKKLVAAKEGKRAKVDDRRKKSVPMWLDIMQTRFRNQRKSRTKAARVVAKTLNKESGADEKKVSFYSIISDVKSEGRWDIVAPTNVVTP
ncbi:MAG: hypothetical protein HZB26_10890 [Candidatus Hydrogenedentes bacterium]|nr:hypothetical protein [Candidatus Hydrogenedentota bacterium]